MPTPTRFFQKARYTLKISISATNMKNLLLVQISSFNKHVKPALYMPFTVRPGQEL